MQKIAVVFDSAGTLLRMYRVAKEIKTGKYVHNIVSTELVGRYSFCALVIMDVDPEQLATYPPGMRVIDFIRKDRIKISIGCARSCVTEEDALTAIENDAAVRMSDLVDTLLEIKKKCHDVSYMGVGLIVDTENKAIPYVIGTGGRVYSNAASVMAELAGMGIDVYIASGDSMRNLSKLAAKLNVSIDSVFDVATPRRKESIVRGLGERYDKVVMVGDAINDIPAMRASDLGILSIQQEGVCRSQKLLEEADVVIKDIGEVPAIVKPLL